MPKFSVQVCCYNSEKYLEDTIKSILNQTYKNWELIIINDGSTDKTEEIVKKFISEGNPIAYYYQERKGFAAARNKAIELSKGEWIAILDHDDLWYPEKLEIQSKSIEKFPEAKIHFSNSEWFKDSGKTIKLTLEENRFDTGVVKDTFLKLLTEGCFIDSETVIMNKSALIDAGGFDENYLYIVDYDAFLRLAKKTDAYYENRVLARWRVHPAQASRIMKETMYREYVELFNDNMKNNPDLPDKVKKEMLKVIASNKIKYALSKLKKGNIKEAVCNISPKEVHYAVARIFERTSKLSLRRIK